MTASLLRRFRKRHGLTQHALAEQLGVSVRTVAGWEGNRPCVYPALLKLAFKGLEASTDAHA